MYTIDESFKLVESHSVESAEIKMCILFHTEIPL